MFCTHAYTATTSGPTGAGGLDTGSIIAIALSIPGTIVAIITVVTTVLGCYRKRKEIHEGK